MMLDSVISLVAIVAMIVIVARQHTRIGLLEREIGALRSFVLSLPAGEAKPAAQARSEAPAVPDAESGASAASAEAAAASAATGPRQAARAGQPALASVRAEAGPPTAEEALPEAASAARPAGAATGTARQPRGKPDIETALGTRWAVWVGGLALALGGVFLIRYSIEAGFFGPEMRLAMAALLGLVLAGVGEFVRRTGFTGPVEGAAGAYVPSILTAAGAFTLFGTVYAAHGVYGFIGPALAFALLGAIGLATIAASLVHGQALAGVGLLGSMATPFLVSSQSPSAWALFGYLAIVLVANAAVARLRDWTLLAAAGFAGVGIWCLLYMSDSAGVDLTVVAFISAVALAALAFVWLGRRSDQPALTLDWPSAVAGLFFALTAMALIIDLMFATTGGPAYGTALLVAMVAVALLRPRGLALLFAAGVAALIVHLRLAMVGSFMIEMMGIDFSVDGFPAPLVSPYSTLVGIVLGLVFLGAGYFAAHRWVGAAPRPAAAWAGWGTLVPLVIAAALWLAFGNIDRDLKYAAATLALAVIFATGAEAIARREEPPLTGGWAVSAALAGAGAALVLAIHMAFGSLLTTVLVGAAAVLPALATRLRSYPALGWLSAGAAIVTLVRIAAEPTIVGADLLGRTPVFNALLPVYGIPAFAFAFAAWQLARTTAGRPRLVMEAAAAVFSLLTVAMLVRHAMHGGVIDSGAPTLAEQAVYTLIMLGFGAILIAIDARSPSSVLRIGSMVAGVWSVLFVVADHFLLLNPLFTDESTGRIPVFDLLFLAYLLPALAAAGLAWYSRGRRPAWYSAMLGLLASALAFAYATLELRRLFQGEHIALWAGMGQIETYAYSALWLAIGVGLLIIGVAWRSQAVRIASAALISIAVAKVFIYDMRELEGVLRALSFIGLGAVLIGIGLFYQRLLTRSRAVGRPTAIATG